MRRLRLKAEYLPLVASGQKRSTVRAGQPKVEPGMAEIVSGPSTIPIRITDVAVKRLDELGDDDARADGFDNLDGLLQALRRFYPDLRGPDPVNIVYFEPTASQG